MNISSIDVDLPIDCDDMYLEVYFAGGTTPSLTNMAAFIHTMRAIPLISYASDTIYGSKKSKRTSGIKEEEGVAVIDSMLNAWYSAIPAHRESYLLPHHSLLPMLICAQCAGTRRPSMVRNGPCLPARCTSFTTTCRCMSTGRSYRCYGHLRHCHPAPYA